MRGPASRSTVPRLERSRVGRRIAAPTSTTRCDMASGVWENPYFADRNGEACAPGRAMRHNGLFLFSLATRTWTRRPDAPEYPGNQGNAAFDATTNSLLVVQPYACPAIGTGSVLTAYNIGVIPLTTTQTPICLTRAPTFPAGPSGWIPPQLASRNYPAWDATTRTMYFCGQITNIDGVQKAVECYKYHRPSNTVTLLPAPPLARPRRPTTTPRWSGTPCRSGCCGPWSRMPVPMSRRCSRTTRPRTPGRPCP
jgi:hypothetical protein